MQLTAEHERAINETLLQFSGMTAVGWEVHPHRPNIIWIHAQNGYVQRVAFTRSLDSLRLVEEKLTEEQWDAYELALCRHAKDFPCANQNASLIRRALRLPVSLRAAALAEVVQS